MTATKDTSIMIISTLFLNQPCSDDLVYFVAHGGRVQGVGFRYFTQKRGTEYGLTGWCRNTDDNKVEGEAQGPEDVLKKFFQDVDQGPRSAKVVKLDQTERDVVDGEKDFQVR
ncbi:Acylphosphatase like protein [Verticillium longisporum]|uniref:acylphosphatase n=1 Tax=Verticillium longisporum TaxID=100787 RepID=A0A8I2Z7A6_VERLO|nr:Acylphosphatase like protein [Verticillium longisporum]